MVYGRAARGGRSLSLTVGARHVTSARRPPCAGGAVGRPRRRLSTSRIAAEMIAAEQQRLEKEREYHQVEISYRQLQYLLDRLIIPHQLHPLSPSPEEAQE